MLLPCMRVVVLPRATTCYGLGATVNVWTRVVAALWRLCCRCCSLASLLSLLLGVPLCWAQLTMAATPGDVTRVWVEPEEEAEAFGPDGIRALVLETMLEVLRTVPASASPLQTGTSGATAASSATPAPTPASSSSASGKCDTDRSVGNGHRESRAVDAVGIGLVRLIDRSGGVGRAYSCVVVVIGVV